MKPFLGSLLLLVVMGCVPMKQFNNTKLEKENLEAELKILQSESEKNLTRAMEMDMRYQRLENRYAALVQDTVRLASLLQSERSRAIDMENQLKALSEQLKKSTHDGEMAGMMEYLQKLQNDLNAREDALRKAEKDGVRKKQEMEVTISELEKTRQAMLAQNSRLAELEASLQKKNAEMNALRSSIADALTGFGTDELNVYLKDGKVYVSLEDKLLFPSGSYEVNASGVAVIRKLAIVLESKPDIQVLIEGHTDDVPYRSGILLDNWDLSVKRATSVARVLMQSAGIDKSRITAAGRSQYAPVQQGTTAVARQKNRRTEIILTPGLDKVINMLQTP
jgi:chemotaxis protein MotB